MNDFEGFQLSEMEKKKTVKISKILYVIFIVQPNI
jgi:hypothetical protein